MKKVQLIKKIEEKNLEQVASVKLLEHTALQFNKVVAHHDGQQRLVACIDCYVECCGLTIAEISINAPTFCT